jgi:hypothetical protein
MSSYYSFRRKLWVRAPDLGNNPLTYSDLFFIATKTIKAGDFFLWYYGHFHGVMRAAKRSAVSSSSNDSSHESSNQSDESDISDDDMDMAMKLSAQCDEDHKLALQLQNDEMETAIKLSTQSKTDHRLALQMQKSMKEGGVEKEKEKDIAVKVSDSNVKAGRGACKRKLDVLTSVVPNHPSGVKEYESLSRREVLHCINSIRWFSSFSNVFCEVAKNRHLDWSCHSLRCCFGFWEC